LHFDVALCYRGPSPCVLIDFPGLGSVCFVCSGGRFCPDAAFTSGGVNDFTQTVTFAANSNYNTIDNTYVKDM
jgi:hypothetical protein